MQVIDFLWETYKNRKSNNNLFFGCYPGYNSPVAEKNDKGCKMKISRWWIISLLFLGGCSNCFHISTRGTEVDSSDVRKIVTGKTTKAEIIALFGVPDQVISRHGSAISTQESTHRGRSMYGRDNLSGEINKKSWGVAAGASHGDSSRTAHSKTTSMATPASAIASQGDVFVYRRIKEASYDLKIGTFESSTAETLTIVFDLKDVVLSYSYKD